MTPSGRLEAIAGRLVGVFVALMVFLVWSVIELFVMVQVAGAIGVVPTVLAVVAMSLAGLWLMKVEGLGSMRRLVDAVERGNQPVDEVLNGALILAGGLLMFIPGFVTGVLGLLLLLPPVRALLRPVLLSRASHRFMEVRVRRAAFSDGFSSRIYDVSSTPDEHRPPTAPGARPGSPPELGS